MKRFLFLLLICIQTLVSTPFVDSFVTSYDFTPQGRYARGYPTYLATKSQDSLVALNNSLTAAGFNIAGRFVICGYEQNAVKPYTFEVDNKNINDESDIKDSSGWSLAPGNLFGFTTGFLFKDCNEFNDPVFRHINPHRVEIFDDSMQLFQKNAFGALHGTIQNVKKNIEIDLSKKNYKAILGQVLDYWKLIYKEDKKTTDSTVVATQDILFSINYGSYLYQSTLPLIKFFTGPDITYPIRVLPIQPIEATINAQSFLDDITVSMQPINNKKTAYIFCSFVDGVGKSTLLGNLINWTKHGKNFVAYEGVNNSSSQTATIYNFKQDVYMVDLPAQVSHYCAKPYGHVFVDVATTTVDAATMAQLGKIDLQKAIMMYLTSLRTMQNGKDIQAGKFYKEYIKNLIRFNVNATLIPIEVADKLFLFDLEAKKLKILVSFDEAHSTGLKTREPELMIFDGVTMPMNYDSFLRDLTTRMQAEGIEEVVFVDFISMYPRSSRENVRINFMLHQLKLLFNDKFDVKNSFYRNLSSHFELYPFINQFKQELIESFAVEIISRDLLNEYILNDLDGTVKKITMDDLIVSMNNKITAMGETNRKKIYDVSRARIEKYAESIKSYKYSRKVEAFWGASLDEIADFSLAVQKIFATEISVKRLNDLWSGMEQIQKLDEETGSVLFKNGKKGLILTSIAADSKDKKVLEELFNVLRVTYYATIIELMKFATMAETMPAIILHKEGNRFYLIQKFDKNDIPLSRYNLFKSHEKEFMFGYNTEDYNNIITTIFWYAQREVYDVAQISDIYVPTSTIVNFIDSNGCWNYVINYIKDHAGNSSILGKDISTVTSFIRILATLELLIKHPESPAMTRYGNKEDFMATIKLIEYITLPLYAGFKAYGTIFSSYESIEPIIPIIWKDQ